jgi:hypothetical protein
MREFLTGGDRRSLGRSQEAVLKVANEPALFEELIACFWDGDPLVRMRAADAAEKASLENPRLLQPFKKELLGLTEETTQKELRWHLALMIARIALTPGERRRAAITLTDYLADGSSIVKALAMQGLADLALQDDRLLSTVIEQIRALTRTGTPAMRARGRKLLPRLELRKQP